MTDRTDTHDVAIDLMRMALGLLDRDNRLLAGARLQHAIDTALETPATRSEADLPSDLVGTILDRPLPEATPA